MNIIVTGGMGLGHPAQKLFQFHLTDVLIKKQLKLWNNLPLSCYLTLFQQDAASVTETIK